LKNQPPTRAIARALALAPRIVARAHAEPVPLYRRARARARTHTRVDDKTGDERNFSQRRQSPREPLIIGLPATHRATVARRAEFWLFFGGLMFVKTDILLSLVHSVLPLGRRSSFARVFVKR